MSLHRFDPDIAQMVGINAAVIHENISHWVRHNEANEMHFNDGKYWTYNSLKAFTELFPYLSKDQIRGAIKKLVDAGLIERGNYNKKGYDKTTWYTVCPMVKIPQPMVKTPHACGENPKPIPDNKPDNKHNIQYKRARVMSDDFIPNPLSLKMRAGVNELTDLEIDHELQQFIDYHTAKGTKSKDWNANWRTWVRNAVKWKAERNAKSTTKYATRQTPSRIRASEQMAGFQAALDELARE